MKTMLDYIQEEYKINSAILENPDLIEEDIFKDKDYKEIIIFATGSSYNACQSARLFMQDILQIPVQIKEPTLSMNYESIWRDDSLYLAISQGGSSASIVKMVDYLQSMKIEVFAITSNPASPLGEIAQRCLDLGMGIETMPYVTAGYAATVVFLWKFSIEMANTYQWIKPAEKDQYLKQIQQVLESINPVIDQTQSWLENHLQDFIHKQRFVFIGYGANYGTVLEAETKFTEIIHKPSHGYELEQYMHGPYLGLGQDDLLFLVDSAGQFGDRMNLLRRFLDKHMKKTYKISLQDGTDQNQDLSYDLDIHENLSPILLTIPIHIISYRISQELGADLHRSYYPDFDEITQSKI